MLRFGVDFAAPEMKLLWPGMGSGLGGSLNRAGQFFRAHSLGKTGEKSILGPPGQAPREPRMQVISSPPGPP